MRIFHILICPPHLPFPKGWSLLCHQTIPQSCHYYAVKVASGFGLEWVMGVRSASVVHDMTGAPGLQVKWTAFWQRAEELNMAGYLTTRAQRTTNIWQMVFTIQRAFMCVEYHPIYNHVVWWKSIWNRCLSFPPSCKNDVLWVIWNSH